MVRWGRKEEATQRIQQMAFFHSEWIPTFCPNLIKLINSWIDPARKHCFLPGWSFKVNPVACPLLRKSEMPWVSFARKTKLFPSHKDLRVQSRLCQNQPVEINKEKTISQCWASATLLSGWRPFAYVWHRRVAEIAQLVVVSWYQFTKGFFEPLCTTWIHVILNTFRPDSYLFSLFWSESVK